MSSRAFCSSRLRTESTDASTSFPSVRGDQSASEAAAGLPAGFFFFHVKNFQGRIKLDETESIANTQTLGVSCCTHRVQKFRGRPDFARMIFCAVILSSKTQSYLKFPSGSS